LTRLWLGAELRARWRVHIVLALLIGVVGTVVLTTGAGARATSSAYGRFLERQAIPTVEFDSLDTDTASVVGHLPGAAAAGTYSPMFLVPIREGQDPRDAFNGNFISFAAADTNYGRTVDRPIVVAGRLPRPDAVDEVAINESGRDALELDVGSRTATRSIAADEGPAFMAGRYDELTAHGPAPTVRVVGVIRTRLDLVHASYAPNYFLGGPAFYKAYERDTLKYLPQLDVRLQRASDAPKYMAAARETVEEANGTDTFSGRTLSTALHSIRDATRVQALSLGLVALAAAVAGLLGLALMAARSTATMAEAFPPLRAMGVTRPGRARLAASALLPATVGGVVLALIGAVLASRLFPTALARRLGPSPGMSFDAVALLPGALVLLAVVLGAAAFSAYRWRPTPLVQSGLYVGPFDRLAGTLPPSPRIGLRWALPRRDAVAGRGRAAVTGAVIGVIALVAAFTYAAGLNHLVTTPSAYGWTFDSDGGGGTDPNETAQMAETLQQNPMVGDVAVARISGDIRVDKASADIYGFESLRGQIGPAVLSGRAPVGQDEILLGSKVARQVHKGVGDDVVLALGPGAPPATLHVVGIGLLPTIESDQFAGGVAMTRAGLEHIPAQAGPELQKLFEENTHVNALWRVKPGVNRERAIAALRKEGLVSLVAEPPGDVRNLDLVRSYPIWLAGFLAAIGLFTVLNALVVSARRRSQQVGILRALGLTRGQIVGAVSTQGASMCLVGALIGVPIGIALGRWTWAASARQLGVAEGLGAPFATVVAIIGFGLVLLLLLGATAGWIAGRATPSSALRVP